MKSNFWNYLLDKFKEGDVTISKTLNELSEEQIKVIHDEIDKVFTKEKEDWTMNKNKTIEEMNSEITEMNRRIEALEKWILKQKEELKAAEETIEAAKKDKENLEMAVEALTEYKGLPEVKEEKKKEEVKVPEKELTYNTKKPKVGRFDSNGNQTGLWCSQKRAAEEIGMAQSNLSSIMRTSKEDQIKKRGCYFAWVY